jgi:Na+-transporting NADH:ubiquinone oxidoreductase subunit NqrD
MSRFGLLAGTTAEGVDPTVQQWGLSATGWTLVLLPFAMFIIGIVVGIIRKTENESLVKDLVS